jgi:hypothetical protein
VVTASIRQVSGELPELAVARGRGGYRAAMHLAFRPGLGTLLVALTPVLALAATARTPGGSLEGRVGASRSSSC